MKIRPYKIWLCGSLIVFVGLCLYPAKIWWEWKQEQVAIEALGKLHVEKYTSYIETPEKYEDLTDMLPTFLQPYLTRVHIVRFDGTNATDDDLKHISELSQLQVLGLSRTRITNEGLKHLANLSQLEELYLSKTKITNHGLENISMLSQLWQLYLNDTQITDDGLKHLSELSRLRILSLEGTKTTDDGLTHLSNLAELEDINIRNTRITDEGITFLLSGTINPKQLYIWLSKGQLSDKMITALKERGVTISYKPTP